MKITNHLKLCITGTIISLLASTATFADSPVWKVSKNGKHIYLGGTMHLLSKSDHPLPKAFDIAYKDSSALVFETDMMAMQAPENIAKMQQAMLSQNGKNLQESLKPETYTALDNYLKSVGVPIANLAPFSPSGVGIMIAVMEMQKMGLDPSSGVDKYYSSLAAADKKSLGELENLEQHLAFIRDMAQGKEDEFILKTLKDVDTMPEIMAELKQAWRTGNNKKLAELAVDEIKRDFPDTYKVLLTDRNLAWLPQIEAMMQTKPVEFILVGAMHLAGDDGLIKLLKKRGYKVDNI